ASWPADALASLRPDTAARRACGWRAPLGAAAGRAGVGSRSGAAPRPAPAAAAAARHRPAHSLDTAPWSARSPPRRRRGAPTPRSALSARAPPAAARRASRVFSEQVLEHLVVQRLLRHQPLQAGVLVLQRLQALRLAHLQAAVLGLPAVEGLLAD